jgi:hypothetical protein
MTRTAVEPDVPDRRPITTAPVGAVLAPSAVARVRLRGYRARRDALLAEAARGDIDRGGYRTLRYRGESV